MRNSQAEIFDKLVEIARLKKEVLQMILPEKTFKHLEVIGNEVKAMLFETVCDTIKAKNDPSKSDVQKSVKKVVID